MKDTKEASRAPVERVVGRVAANNGTDVTVSGCLLVIEPQGFPKEASVAVLTHDQARQIVRALIAAHDLNDDVERQEEVVGALWAFADDQQMFKHNIKQEKAPGVYVTASDKAIRSALERIMGTFGCGVVSIQ